MKKVLIFVGLLLSLEEKYHCLTSRLYISFCAGIGDGYLHKAKGYKITNEYIYIVIGTGLINSQSPHYSV